MKQNPANAIKTTMWKFLMDKGQKENIPALKKYVFWPYQNDNAEDCRSEKRNKE